MLLPRTAPAGCKERNKADDDHGAHQDVGTGFNQNAGGNDSLFMVGENHLVERVAHCFIARGTTLRRGCSVNGIGGRISIRAIALLRDGVMRAPPSTP